MAISLCLAAARDRSRLATFVQAISNTRLTAASSKNGALRTLPPTHCWYNDTTSAPTPLLDKGYCFSSRLAMVSISVLAISTEIPFFHAG
jgi:hypothetical protein